MAEAGNNRTRRFPTLGGGLNPNGEIIAAFGIIATGYPGNKSIARSAEETKRIETTRPDWDAFTECMMQRLDAQQVELKNQADQIISLRSRVETLQETIECTRRKYWAAIGGIRRIVGRDKSALDIARLPPDVQEDVLNGCPSPLAGWGLFVVLGVCFGVKRQDVLFSGVSG
ncbi:hypothetical protein ACKFR3_01575 [Corynebacterium marquesiae]|uniref:hypothetical protein n=1 Tax=Corynebacterium marquesiae TaxID=2913503 RepID=UPI0038CFC8A2